MVTLYGSLEVMMWVLMLNKLGPQSTVVNIDFV